LQFEVDFVLGGARAGFEETLFEVVAKESVGKGERTSKIGEGKSGSSYA
jgi:hypothetical protein